MTTNGNGAVNGDRAGSGTLKYTGPAPELTQKVVTAIKGGAYPVVAARWCGVAHRSWYRWLETGRSTTNRMADADDRGMEPDPLTEYEENCLALVEAVETAEAELELRLGALWNAEANGDWRAAQAMLRTRCKDRWREAPTEITGAAGGPIELALGEVAAAINANPEAVAHAEAALAAIAPVYVPGMPYDEELADSTVAVPDIDDDWDGMPDVTQTFGEADDEEPPVGP